MLPLASISGLGIIVLLIVGCLVFKVARGGLRSAPGFILKTLGVVAVLAGLGVLVSRHDRHEHADIDHALVQGEIDRGLSHLREEIGGDLEHLHDELDEHLHDHLGRNLHISHDSTLHRGLLILLGSGLIILGAMLFGRDRTRPFALKALTFLGVGAIIFSVASFFGEPPRAEPTVRMVNVERYRVEPEEHRIAKRPVRPTRAKRPALRPDRPSSALPAADESLDDFLPPRAGEIPVAAELAKAERQAAIEKLATEERQPAAAEEESKPAEVKQEVVKVDEPKVAETPVVMPPVAEPEVDEPKVETPVVVAEKPAEEPAPAQEAPAAAVPAAEAAAAAPAKPAEEAKPAEAAQPRSAPPAVIATEVAATEVVAESQSVETKPAENKPVETAAKPAEPQPAAEVPAAIVPSLPRPDWVDRAPGLSDGVYALVVSSGPYSSVPECQRALNEEILSATNHYINEYLGDDNAASLVNLPVSFSRQVIKKQEYAESLESPSVGRMYQLHAQLAFDDQARNLFQQRWRNAIVQDRLWYTGGGAALVLALLATFYGYLKLDLKTDAPHKGRLQLAATLVALLVAAGALLARWAVPF
jgi:hypothetical protein